MFRMPWSSLVPERLTALVTNPVARPNSAVIAPRLHPAAQRDLAIDQGSVQFSTGMCTHY